MGWLFSAVFAQFAICAANFTDKLILEKYIKNSEIVFLFSGVVAFGVGLLIWGVRGWPVLPANQILIALAAGICWQFFLLPYFKALNLNDTSLVVVLHQMIPVFTLVLSLIFLHERILEKQYLGFAFIFTCSIFLSWRNPKLEKSGSKVFWLMALSSLLFAAGSVLFKLVVSTQNFWDSLAYQGLGMGFGVLITLTIPKYLHKLSTIIKETPTAGWQALGLSETFYVIYRFLLTTAYSMGPATLVNMTEGLNPLILLVYGWVLTIHFPKFIKENVDLNTLKRKILAIIGIFVGLYLVYT